MFKRFKVYCQSQGKKKGAKGGRKNKRVWLEKESLGRQKERKKKRGQKKKGTNLPS